MKQGAVFRSSRSQAIRLPKAVALPDGVKCVNILAVGRTRIISPADEEWDSWFDGDNVVSDFMEEREQPSIQERDARARIRARSGLAHRGLGGTSSVIRSL